MRTSSSTLFPSPLFSRLHQPTNQPTTPASFYIFPLPEAAGSFPEKQRDQLMFLDIGSNHGFFVQYAAGMAPFITAYAFEPQPQCAEFIEVRSPLLVAARRGAAARFTCARRRVVEAAAL